jgi:nucleotide-binding universal stress UspA family protein
MTVVVWIVEGTWPACVDAARRFVPEETDIVLLHVSSENIPAVAHGAYVGLFGRAEPRQDPGPELNHLAAESAATLLRAAATRLGRPCRTEERVGRVEREVLVAAEGAGLLVVARDEECTALGPKSVGHVTRSIVDRALCPVLLVWPEAT